MSRSRFRVFPYPKAGYQSDVPVQQRLTARSMRGERVVGLIFLGSMIAFVSGVVGGFLGYAKVAVAAIPFGILPPLALLFWIRSPKCLCSACGREMKKVWASIDTETGRHGQYLICEGCHRYAYTHKAERQ
jgi:hypothetical protein